MDEIELLTGSHTTRQQGLCVMEAVAYFSGEPHSDRPLCACPVISAFARWLNDNLDAAHRQELKPLIPALALSKSTREIEVKRAYLVADFAVRRAAPYALDMRGFKDHAERLRALDPIVDQATAHLARKKAAADAAAVYAAAVYAAAVYADAVYADAAAAAVAAVDAADAVYAAVKSKPSQDWLLTEGLALLNAMLAVR